jgi:hypothetical protein
MAKKKRTKAEREEMEARHERMLANAERTRQLAEKGLARLQEQEREQQGGG